MKRRNSFGIAAVLAALMVLTVAGGCLMDGGGGGGGEVALDNAEKGIMSQRTAGRIFELGDGPEDGFQIDRVKSVLELAAYLKRSESRAAITIELDGKKLGRCRMSIISDASADSLHPFIESNVAKGSSLITDGWSGYGGIEKLGYSRDICIQKNAQGDDHLLPHIHTIISLLKRWLLGTHQGAVEQKHLQSYLDEYVFRFNRRKSAQRGLLFYRLLESAMHTETITYDELVNRKI
jgi:transposase-like protein